MDITKKTTLPVVHSFLQMQLSFWGDLNSIHPATQASSGEIQPQCRIAF